MRKPTFARLWSSAVSKAVSMKEAAQIVVSSLVQVHRNVGKEGQQCGLAFGSLKQATTEVVSETREFRWTRGKYMLAESRLRTSMGKL